MSGIDGSAHPTLRERVEALQISAHPDEDQWGAFIQAISDELHQRDTELQELSMMATASSGELNRMRQSLARQYEDLERMLDLLANAVHVFHEAVGGDQGALTQALGIARHRFSLTLNAEWCEEPMVEDTADLNNAKTSVRALQQSLLRLSRAIADLVQEASAMASTRKELELAGAVQQMLVPPAKGVTVPGARLYSWFQPAAHCGGDWWSAHDLTEDNGLVLIGDVTGHGAPSAIITGAVKGACDLARMGMRGSLRPSQLMRMLNRVIAEAARGEYMMTSIALTIAREDSPKVLLTNAGHRAPWLIRDGALTVVQGGREPPLGAEAAVPYTELAVNAEPGDLLILQTDGILEAEDSDGNQLGEKAVRDLCEAHASMGAEGLRDKVREAVHQHMGAHPQVDDITLVIVEIE